MLARRHRGETLQQIATDFGVSRERVRQITAHAGPSRDDVKDTRRKIAHDRAHAEAATIVQRWVGGGSPEEIARDLGLLPEVVRGIIDELASETDRAHRRRAINDLSGSYRQQYSDDDLRAAIRRVARTLGRTPSAADYSQFATELGLPSGILIVNRLGWRNAVQAAGLEPLLARRRNYERRWTEDFCFAVLSELVIRLGRVPRYAEYERIAAGRDDLPSGPTVRKRFNGWANARLQLARHLDSHSC